MLSRRLLLKHQFIRLTCVKTHARCSSQVAVEPDLTGTTEVRLSALKPKQPTREPFAKNLFIGRFDVEFLAYPEPQTHDRHREFFAWLKPIEDYVNNHIDIGETDRAATIPTEVFEELQRLGVMRAAVHESYGGLGLNNTEYAKLVETVSVLPALGTFLIKRASVVNLIDKFASAEQKSNILPKIASGELRPALCFSESPSGSTSEPPESKAILSSCRNYFAIDGRKTWVMDAADANLFVVLANRSTADPFVKLSSLGAFLVPSDAKGVSVGQPLPMMGQRGLKVCDVTFENVVIPFEDELGEKDGSGDKDPLGQGAEAELFASALGHSKHYVGGQAVGMLKRFLNILTNDVRRGKNFNSKMCQDDLLHETVGKIASSLYSMEAITYMTTGMMDNFESQDCLVEQSLVHSHCTNACVENIIQGFKLLGTKGYCLNEPYEQVMRDALALTVYDRAAMDMKIFAALMGVQHAGLNIGKKVKKDRNAMYHPMHVVKNLLKFTGDEKLYLDENLHPSLRVSAMSLERCVHNLKKCVETLLVYNGISLMSHRMELKRLADIVIEVYAMTAVVARASRSYCIGIRNAEHEVQVAMMFTYLTYEKVNTIVNELTEGDWVNGDVVMKDMAQAIFKKKSYFAEHPLERTY